jgi:predicted outer membrane repeat protein
MAGAGGAIYALSTLRLNDSTFEGNSAATFGGAVAGEGFFSDVNCNNCDFTGNAAGTRGGAIDLFDQVETAMINGSTFSGNTAQNGGALATELNRFFHPLKPFIFYDTFTGNTAVDGGAVYADFGDDLFGCAFFGNVATDGGAIYTTDLDGGFVLTCTLSGNTAQRGGAVFAGATTDIGGSTLSGNRVTDSGQGGGLYTAPTGCVLDSTIIAGNLGTGGVADDIFGPLSNANVHFTLVGDGTGTTLVDGVNGNQVGTREQPIDPRLGPLQDNGGPTLTMALLRGSPALNRGDPYYAGVRDQRGTIRGGKPSIGAFEPSAAVSIQLIAPAEVTAGQPFTVTVVALDAWGNVASLYDGTVHFTSTDDIATLPPDHAFTGDDGGRYGVPVTLRTAGVQQLQVTDPVSLFTALANVLVD